MQSRRDQAQSHRNDDTNNLKRSPSPRDEDDAYTYNRGNDARDIETGAHQQNTPHGGAMTLNGIAKRGMKKRIEDARERACRVVTTPGLESERREKEETERLKKKEAEDTVRIVSGDGEREFVIPRTAACHSGLLLSLFGRQGDESDEDEVDPLGGEAFPVPYPAGVLDACFAYAMEAPRAPTHA